MAVATGGEGFILGLKLYWLKFFNFGIDKYQLLILTLANQIASQLPETWDGVSNPVKVKGVNASQNILYIYVNNWEHLKLWIQSQLRVTITVAGFSAGRDKEVLAPSPSLAGGGQMRGERWGNICRHWDRVFLSNPGRSITAHCISYSYHNKAIPIQGTATISYKGKKTKWQNLNIK